MNINFQRAVDRLAGVPICAALSLLEKLRGGFVTDKTAPPRRILIVLLSEMGSLVLAQPMFAELKRRYPDAELHMLMFAKNREVLDLLGVMPKEHVITLNDKALGSFAADSLNALRRMRALDFDVVIDCELIRASAASSLTSRARRCISVSTRTRRKGCIAVRS